MLKKIYFVRERNIFRLIAVCLLFSAITFSAQAEIELFLAPDGGWDPVNKDRTITLNAGKEVKATLNNAVLDLIHTTRDGGQIKIAMYAFSDATIQDVLIETAFKRNVKIKILLDGVAAWTKDIRKEFYAKVKAAQKLAPPEKQLNFQIKVVDKASFVARGRTRKLDSGETIYGTMHEKFGVFYQPDMKVPFDSFAGSSNLSIGSDQKFSENRFVFKNDPSVARQFAEEFARLWNEYGVDVLANAESEPYIPADPAVGGVRVIFNCEPIDEERNYRIDRNLLDHIDMVNRKGGTIDIMMFSFTHFQLAQRILELAQRYPEITIRIIMDQAQIISDENHRGILGPYMEEKAEELGIKNLHIRYKWRTNVFRWAEDEKATEEKKDPRSLPDGAEKIDPDTDGVPAANKKQASQPTGQAKAKIEAIHWRNLILHHKVLIVNGNRMIAGSFNWSASAEERNFENVMVFNSSYPGQKDAIDRMLAEFNLMWKSVYDSSVRNSRNKFPQVISGSEGRKKTEEIFTLLSKKGIRPILEFIDNSKFISATFKELLEATKQPQAELKENLKALVTKGILYIRMHKDDEVYGLAD